MRVDSPLTKTTSTCLDAKKCYFRRTSQSVNTLILWAQKRTYFVPCIDEVNGTIEFLVSDPSLNCFADKKGCKGAGQPMRGKLAKFGEKLTSRTKPSGDRDEECLSLCTFR